MCTRTEAARTRSDADYASLSTALSRTRCRRHELVCIRTWTCTWARFSTGPYGDCRRTHTPCSSWHHPLRPPTHSISRNGTPTKVTRDDDGAPGQGPLAEKSSPAACRQGHWSHSRCCPYAEKNSSSSQRHSLAAGTPSTNCHARKVLPPSRRW